MPQCQRYFSLCDRKVSSIAVPRCSKAAKRHQRQKAMGAANQHARHKTFMARKQHASHETHPFTELKPLKGFIVQSHGSSPGEASDCQYGVVLRMPIQRLNAFGSRQYVCGSPAEHASHHLQMLVNHFVAEMCNIK